MVARLDCALLVMIITFFSPVSTHCFCKNITIKTSTLLITDTVPCDNCTRVIAFFFPVQFGVSSLPIKTSCLKCVFFKEENAKTLERT